MKPLDTLLRKIVIAQNNVQESQPARIPGEALTPPLLPHAGWTYRATSSLHGRGAPALQLVSRGVRETKKKRGHTYMPRLPLWPSIRCLASPEAAKLFKAVTCMSFVSE